MNNPMTKRNISYTDCISKLSIGNSAIDNGKYQHNSKRNKLREAKIGDILEYRRYYFLILFSLILGSQAFTQNSIQGKITDKDTKQVLAYANVYLPEQTKGTQTNEEGFYSIQNLPSRKVKLQISYVGYKTIFKTVFVNDANTTVNIEMEPTILQAEEVVVSGVSISSQHQTPLKIESIKSSAIAATGTPTFMEALANLPGVDMIAKGVGVAKPVIRGLSMTNILMLNNGVKMENFQFSEDHPFLIDEFGVDHIEVIKGPASLLYGSDAVGGVINVIKERPAPINQIVGDYSLQLHSNTSGIVNNLGLKGSSEKYFWGFRIGSKSHADYRDGDGNYVPNTRFNENSLKADIGMNRSYGLFRIFYDYNRAKLGLCVADVIPLISERGRKNEFWYQDLSNHILSTRNSLFLGNFKIEANAAYQLNNRRLQTDNAKPNFEMVDMDLQTFSYELKTYLPSSENSEYILGIQGADKSNQNHEAPNHILPNAQVNDFSVFGLIQSTLLKKIKAQAGLRYDFRSIATEAETNKAAVNSKYGNLSASAGATYALNQKILFRANIASAYRTPNIAELTQNGMHGVRYEEGNPALKSQRSYEADLSSHYHSKKVMLDISAFYNHINNYIFLGPTEERTAEDVLIYKYTQTNSKLYGGELSIDLLPVDFLDAKLTYSYLIGKQADGNYLPFIPQNKIRFEIKLQKKNIAFLKENFLKIGGVFAQQQDKPSTFETASNSYFLLNVGIGTHLNWKRQKLSLSIQANNLLNAYYIDHLSTLKELAYANIGRNISLNLKIPFGLK